MLRTRSRRFTACVLTAASAMLATTALTFTADAAPKPTPKDAPKDSVKVLDWLADKQSDTKPDRLRVGSEWTAHAHLYTHKKGRPGKKIGDASSRCSVVDLTRHGYVALCHRVLRTDDGSISLSDSIDRFGRYPHGGRSAVTGGTGKYVDAEGEAEITFIDGDLARFRILLDD
ncbi:hypothetical protein AMK26_03955 [Streptomyces sp. CB03234]|uniref:hypothetical protein n=1 Tax=Streptomyces sp. (strain CB03234) TaxID=1703937 RepID=UPI00093D19C9|nr:hypothetical protein [Streptomyces sp. CB03234]OKK08183.1 hypothetical protein AMK26_03955 [Streptomyces sp. CB03234]